MWFKSNKMLLPIGSSTTIDSLPNKIFEAIDTEKGVALMQLKDKFEFNFERLPIGDYVIDVTLKTWDKMNGNLGIMLKGTKGGCKTVTAKTICNEIGLPIILVNNRIDGLASFINNIEQDIVIFFDEFEKTYKDNIDKLATLLDGVLTSKYKRLFILTCNTMNDESVLMDRPTRIRYVFDFTSMSRADVEMVVDKFLINKSRRDDLINFIFKLKTQSFDTIRQLIEEINMFDTSFEDLIKYFNIRVYKEDLTFICGDIKFNLSEFYYKSYSENKKSFYITEYNKKFGGDLENDDFRVYGRFNSIEEITLIAKNDDDSKLLYKGKFEILEEIF